METTTNRLMIPVEDWDGTTRYGKKTSTYVARITGPGDEFPLERKFLRRSVECQENGTVLLPSKDGVYEVRDWPGGERRVRYYQVRNAQMMELPETADDDDVLQAVEASALVQWGDALEQPNGVASTGDALIALDAAEAELIELLDQGIDDEDVRMALDKVRKVVEAL